MASLDSGLILLQFDTGVFLDSKSKINNKIFMTSFRREIDVKVNTYIWLMKNAYDVIMTTLFVQYFLERSRKKFCFAEKFLPRARKFCRGEKSFTAKRNVLQSLKIAAERI